MSRYRDLKVYVKSYELAKEIYRAVSSLEVKEPRITDQVRRSATSIPANIAEGYGKGMGDRETIRYLKMARGSASETTAWLDFLKDFGYLEEEVYQRYSQGYEEVGKMLTGLIRKLQEEKTND